MGMYTEVFARVLLKRDLSESTFLLIKDLAFGDRETDLPIHPLFEDSRWPALFRGSSTSFPGLPESGFSMGRPNPEDGPCLFVHSSLKNYNSTAEKFFDWIQPLSGMYVGDFHGYSLYEDSKKPQLYFKTRE